MGSSIGFVFVTVSFATIQTNSKPPKSKKKKKPQTTQLPPKKISLTDDFYYCFQVPVSDLAGKTILLYFSAHWCPPCRAFLPKLIDAYKKIKERNESLEVVFISSDRDQTSFDEFFKGMPWLALPFGDARKASLSRKFKVSGIPMLVAIGPSGRTITKEARDMIAVHGAEAYPFTEERMKEIDGQYNEMAKGWPENVKHALHEHELVLDRCGVYSCDGCDEEGRVWAFSCDECDFCLHPNCALGEDKGTKDDKSEEQNPSKEGWRCDGGLCYKG